MKNKLHNLWNSLGHIVCAVAIFSVYLGHPHCLLIIHQPKVPKELKYMQSEDENFNM